MNYLPNKSIRSIIVLSFICFFVSQCFANDYDIAKNVFQSADKELNDAYKKVLSKYSENELFIRRFREAQRAWIKYRDSHLASRYPVEKNQIPINIWGTSFQNCAWYELAEMTNNRTMLIRRWLKPVEEGDVCSGSYK